jgi:hypothetical protein
MDLGTIEESKHEGQIQDEDGATRTTAQQHILPDIQSFVDDVREWSNCLLFNGATSPLTRSAYLLSHLFEATWRQKLSEAVLTHLSRGGVLLIYSSYIKKTNEMSSRDGDGDSGVDEEDIIDYDDSVDHNNMSGNDGDHHGGDDDDDDDDDDDNNYNDDDDDDDNNYYYDDDDDHHHHHHHYHLGGGGGMKTSSFSGHLLLSFMRKSIARFADTDCS